MTQGRARTALRRGWFDLRGALAVALSWWERQPHHVPAAVMLVTVWLVFYAWVYAPDALQAEAWNMGGALGRVVLLGLVVLAYRSLPVTVAALWWCFEDAQVVGCGVLWMFAPWPVDTGSGRCSDLLGWPLGLVGITLGSCAAWVIFRQAAQGRKA